MLETLIKRSGEREAFNSSKTNGWMVRIGHDLIDRMDWSSIVIECRNTAPEVMTSQEWQLHLINNLKTRGSQPDGWPYMLFAGRLYTIYQMKKIHGDQYPHLKDVVKFLISKGLARDMGYTEEELDYLNDHVIDHTANMNMAWTQVEQYNTRYSLKDFVTGETYETPQYTAMRMAMAVYEKDTDKATRMDRVAKLYSDLRDDLLNPPSPNYAALGTRHYGMASCCLIAADDTAASIQAAGNVGYSMTLASGGLGMHLRTRAPGDPVDGGRVMHAGRLNYIRKFVGDCCANKQGARGGAMTVMDTIYSPEVDMNTMLQNPRTPAEMRERKINVSYQTNPFFTRKAGNGEDIFEFSCYSAPDLYAAFFKEDQTEFEELYAKYEADPNFTKRYRSASELLAMVMGQEVEQSTLFWCNSPEMARHSSFKKGIIQTNLCHEIVVPTAPWVNMAALYDPAGLPENGETGMCNIGSIPVHRMPFNPANPHMGFERYKRSVRSMMEIIDYAIDNSEYHYPAIRTQATSRRNASVGMSGVATLFAKMGLKFNTPEGRRAWHVLNERHMFACIEVALEMGKERGNAPWINGPKNDGVDGTRWVDGWLPIDTYKKTIDSVVDSTLMFDWEDLRSRVVANKGIRFSSLVAHMPGEQATRKGNGSNSIYPLTELSVDLSDGKSAMPWAALDNDLIADQYQVAWDLSDEDVAIHYGICQKFTDQAISADWYEDRRGVNTVDSKKLINRHILRVRYGNKTAYYTRSLTERVEKQEEIQSKTEEAQVSEFPAVSTLPQAESSAASVTMSALDRIAAQARAMQADSGLSCTMDGNCGA